MKKHLLWMAAAAVCLAACTSDPVVSEDATVPPPEQTTDTEQATLSTAKLASFAASQARFAVEPQTRADANPLQLIASIANLSKEGGIGFTPEEGGRYLSATCVYYDPATETYYATYHMQGNNYNTDQTVETKGYIETFKIENGEPVPGTVYYSDSESLDFDFNHLYFDVLSSQSPSYAGNYKGSDAGATRIIAVGHNSKPSSKEGGEPNTAAIIGQLNLDGTPTFTYEKVSTAEKIYDTAGRVIDKVGAGDVNCVIRKYDWYYLATRKGIAVLSAKPEDLFKPVKDADDNIYFIETPGSVKSVAHVMGNGGYLDFLYLTQPTPDGFTAATSSPANVLQLAMEDYDGTLIGGNTSDRASAGKLIDCEDITTWSKDVNQFSIPDAIYPVDGKNVLAAPTSGRVYACLGKSGLYVRLTGSRMNEAGTASEPYVEEQTITFSDKTDGTGSRPVNAVFVEDYDSFKEYGYIYVANGVCLTVLNYYTLETVADFTLGKDSDGSANYVHVVKDPETNDRIVTVAYGQEGVKVLRFTPPAK